MIADRCLYREEEVMLTNAKDVASSEIYDRSVATLLAQSIQFSSLEKFVDYIGSNGESKKIPEKYDIA